MLIIPAIDLKDCSVVRLLRGDFNKKTVYSDNPVEAARHWIEQGAELIHIVDLDGAREGKVRNLPALKDILKETPARVEFGGGVRTIETIEELLQTGVSRVILGTKAAQDKEFLKQAFERFKDKIIVSIDAKNGEVQIQGWEKDHKKLNALTLAADLKELGFRELIYTDISKDGTLEGPNIPGLENLIKNTGMNVIASGGISSLDDIKKLKLLENNGVTGIIIGKALYEGKFTLTEALKLS